MVSSAIWAAFSAAADEPTHTADIVDALHQAELNARTAWPDLPIPPEVFARTIGTAVRGAENVASAIAALAIADLFLATGCTLGLAPALAAFMHGPAQLVDAQFRRRAPAADLADLLQVFWQRVLTGEHPRIAEYRGRSPLGHWLRVVAARFLIDTHRHRRTSAKRLAPVGIDAMAEDPETVYLQRHYGKAVSEAFAQAVAALPARSRLLLRYHFVERLSTEQIGQLFAVHAATARRWLAETREALLSDTQDRLQEQLGVQASELSSLIRLARSQLDVSLRGLLAPPEPAP